MNNPRQPQIKINTGVDLVSKVATTLQLGPTKKKNVVVNYIVLNMAKLMLAKLSPNDKATREVAAAAESQRKRMNASHTKEELEPIQIMVESAMKMAERLAEADSLDGLIILRHFMDEVAGNRVLIMEADEPIDPAGLTNPAQ